MSAPAQCHGKKVYTTKAEALRARDAMRGVRRRKRFGKLMPYKCPYCGLFHLGTKSS